MISVYRWDDAQKKGGWLDLAAFRDRAAELRQGPDVLWIDLETPTPEEESFVLETFWPIHPLTLEDLRRQRVAGSPHFPKVEEFKDYLFVVANPLAPALIAEMQSRAIRGTTRAVTQLGALITLRVLITHHEEPLAAIQTLHHYLDRHEAQAERGPDYLFHIILDEMVDSYAPVLDHVDDHLGRAEEEILKQSSTQLLGRLLALKRRIISLRKTLVYEREVLARLSRGEFELINDRETVYYRNVYDHLVRFTELIESSRDMASDLAQTHLAAVSNRLNQIMKVLTMISTIVLPMSLVTGVYGMNFEFMPELRWPWGYAFALGLMGLVGLGSLALFRWKKWI